LVELQKDALFLLKERTFVSITPIVRIYYSRKNMKGQDVLPLGPALWAARILLICEAFERIGHSYELVWSIILIRNWYQASSEEILD
jgi:hypothetical protein